MKLIIKTFNYFQLKDYHPTQIITINFSEDCNATLPIKNIEVILGTLYLDLNLNDVENLDSIFEFIINNECQEISTYLIYDIKNKILKIRLDSPFIYENRKYKIKFNNIIHNFKVFSDLLSFIQDRVIPNIKQKIELGICVFTFDKIHFERMSDNELIMQTEYKNGINCYILNDTVIEIDLQQDVLSINNIKSC